MGNQPSSPHHSYTVHPPENERVSRHSRSRSRTPSVVTPGSSGGHLKPHRSMRRKTKSIELPDLNGPIVPQPHARRVPGPISQPIPIGGTSALAHTSSTGERLIGGEYGLHIPHEVAARASGQPTKVRDHTTERAERRAGRPERRVNHQQMANLMYQVEQTQIRTPAAPLPSPLPSPLESSNTEPNNGHILHSRLRFGLKKQSLVKAGLLHPTDILEEDEETLMEVATAATQEVTVISPSEVASGLVTPAAATVLDALDASTAVEIKWTEGGESVQLCLYASSVAGLGNPDSIGPDELGDGTYVMHRSEDGATFTKLLNLGPGTHHMRFLVATDASSAPSTPVPDQPNSSYQTRLSSILPTSPDPSGTLSNYVVVAPLKTPGVGVDGKLEVGEGGGAQVRPLAAAAVKLAAAAVKRAVHDMPAPELKLPPGIRRLHHGTAFGQGAEPGQSFWSKDSEDQDSGPSDPEDEDEERRREREYDEQRRERERDKEKAGWTNDIPLELLAAAEEEEKFIEDCKRRDEEAARAPGPLVQTGFHTAPPIPGPPVVPRHLDKLILNHKSTTTTQRDGSPGGSGSPTRGGHRSRDGRESRQNSRLHRSERKEERKPIIPVTTASGTDVTASALLSTTSNAAAALTSASSFLTSSSGSRYKQFGQTPLTSLVGNEPSLTAVTDDASVLPVPSHVVLNHLSTSAIRNGVIAVGGTVRYREKYLTTIYYRPT